MTAAIDNVIFDFGNVLIEWDPYGPYEGFASRNEVDDFFEEIDFHAFNHLQDRGRSWAEARLDLGRTHPHRLAMLDRYLDHFEASLRAMPSTEVVVRELVSAGIRVFGLTNWSAETFPSADRTAPAIGLMEQTVVSGSVGLAKPETEIYRLAIDRFQIDPARTAFFDDSQRNIDAALSIGLQAFLFTDVAGLRADLDSLGVLLAQEN